MSRNAQKGLCCSCFGLLFWFGGLSFFYQLFGSRILMTLKGNFQHVGKTDFISLLLCPVPAVKGEKRSLCFNCKNCQGLTEFHPSSGLK